MPLNAEEYNILLQKRENGVPLNAEEFNIIVQAEKNANPARDFDKSVQFNKPETAPITVGEEPIGFIEKGRGGVLEFTPSFMDKFSELFKPIPKFIRGTEVKTPSGKITGIPTRVLTGISEPERVVANLGLGLLRMQAEFPLFVKGIIDNPALLKQIPREIFTPVGRVWGSILMPDNPKFKISEEEKESLKQHPEVLIQPLLVPLGVRGLSKGVTNRFAKVNADIGTAWARELTSNLKLVEPSPTVGVGTAKILSKISIGERSRDPLSFNKAYTWLLDDTQPIKVAVDAITEGVGIPELSKNPGKLAELYRGWTGRADAFVNRGIPDANFNKVGISLKETLAPIRHDIDGFRAYLVAKRAKELSNRGIESGFDLKAVEQTLIEKESPMFQQAQQNILKYQNAILNELVNTGVISREMATTMNEMNRSYVPFHRVFQHKNYKGFKKAGFADLPQPIKRIKGSVKDVVDPLESMIKNTYLFVNLAERNRVGLALADLTKKFPKSQEWIKRIKSPTRPVKFNITEIENQLADLGVDLSSESIEGIAQIFRPTIFGAKQKNILSVFRGGKREYYQMQPDLYESVLALDKESSGLLINMLSIPARTLRAGAILTPEFLLRNPLRDVMTATVFAKGHPFDFGRGLFHALKKDDLYFKWKTSGAPQATLVSMDRNYLQKSLREALAKNWFDRAISEMKNPIELLRNFSELSENATRLGVFRREAIKGGLTKESIRRGASLSRDATVDFGRKGTKTIAANKTIAFFNASIQGIDKMARVFKNDPIGATIRSLSYITAPSIALYMINRDNDAYKSLPRWRKDLFWNIPMGNKTFLSIPKPFELGITFGTAAERIAEYIDSEDPKAFDGLASAMWEAGTPSVIPQAFIPYIESVSNKNLFTGGKLIPQRLEGIEPFLQFNLRTTETAKAIGEALNLSPIKLENTIRGLSGGLGLHSLRAMDSVLDGLGLIERQAVAPTNRLQDIPGIRGIITGEPFGQASEITEFYNELARIEQIDKTYKELIRIGRQEDADIYFNQNIDDIDKVKKFRKVSKRFAKIFREIRRIQTDSELSPIQKRNKLREEFEIISEETKIMLNLKTPQSDFR